MKTPPAANAATARKPAGPEAVFGSMIQAPRTVAVAACAGAERPASAVSSPTAATPAPPARASA